MNANQETIADIIAEMRAKAKHFEGGSGLMVSESALALYLYPIADRIEAAWKRELEFPKSQSVDADKRTGKDINRVIDDLLKSSKWYYHRGDIVHGKFCRVTADRIREALKRESGNAAAMREALIKLKQYMRYNTCSKSFCIDSLDLDAFKVIQSAIDAPLKNCDRFMTFSDAWNAFCSSNTMLIFPHWLFALAEERKGGNDGK